MRRSFNISSRMVDLHIHSSLICKLLAYYQKAEDRIMKARRQSAFWGLSDLEREAKAEQASLYYLCGQYQKELALAQSLIGEASMEEAQTKAWNTMGCIQMHHCEFDLALKFFRCALDIYRQCGQETLVASCLHNIAHIHYLRG